MNSQKRKKPGIAKFVSIFEMITGTALIIFSIPMFMGSTAPAGILLFLIGGFVWFLGISYFNFKKWAWYGSLIYLIFAVIGSVIVLYDRLSVLGTYFEEPEIIGSIIAIILNIVLLIMVLAAKKHLKQNTVV